MIVAGRKEKMQVIGGEIDKYATNFEAVVKTRMARDKAVNERMNVFGLKARTNLSEIIKTAMADGDTEAAATAGEVQEALMQMRLYAVRFVAAAGPEARGRDQAIRRNLSDGDRAAHRSAEEFRAQAARPPRRPSWV